MSCPNINSPQWKNLVEALDEDLAYKVFALNPELDKAAEKTEAVAHGDAKGGERDRPAVENGSEHAGGQRDPFLCGMDP